jgi:SAM-dependent methyltransferase
MSWKITDTAHELMRNTLRPGDSVIDATVGNGHDTVFLADLVGESGFVFGFDIQEAAISTARRRICGAGYGQRVQLNPIGHEHMGASIPIRQRGKIGGIMFNLGYLPGAEDKSIITTPENTVKALEAGIDLLRPNGLITIVIYVGHGGGKEEASAVHDWLAALHPSRFESAEHRSPNQTNKPPYLIAVSRKA